MHQPIVHRAPRLFKKTELSLVLSALLFSPYAVAGPQGGVVTSGAAAIGQAGGVTRVDQSSQKAAINWQSFNVGRNERVDFNQPNASAITLNRVLGNERSVIDGALNANGKVFLVNSAGVLFTKGSSVNTSGFVASTLNLSDDDFNAGRYTFRSDGSGGSVINMGTITAKDGGYVALLGRTVSNQGVISATKGTVAMNSGDRITLNFNGDSLLSVTIDEGALNALVENKQAVYADGGQVIMTAKAADDLLSAQVNNTGLVQAHTIDDLKGHIELNAQGGTTHVDGTLDASAPTSGEGGFIETSGDRVDVTDNAMVTTLATQGKTGKWLIDPNDFTIAATGGNMTGAAVSNALAKNDFEIDTNTMGTAGGNGDINVDQAVTWDSSSTLTLKAQRNININANITATGDSAGLVMNYGGDYNILTPASFSGTVLDENGNPVANHAPDGTTYASITLSGAQASLEINGNTYTLIHSLSQLDELDQRNGATGTGTATGVNGFYAIAQDLDGTGTSYKESLISSFVGTLAGLGHTVNNLTIVNSTALTGTGLIGQVVSGTGPVSIRDIGLANVDITANRYGGALIGRSLGSNVTISHSYSTGKISAGSWVGGLIGALNGPSSSISDSFSDVAVSGFFSGRAGGLVGETTGSTITNSHAKGSLSGYGSSIGGLIGNATDVDVTDSYAAGNITNPSNFASNDVGGLIGSIVANTRPVSVTNSLATGVVAGAGRVGGLIGRAGPASGAGVFPIGIDNSYATGDVTSTGLVGADGRAGGLVGLATNTNINHSHASGAVSIGGTGSIGGGAGGLVGILQGGSIANSSASGNVTGLGNSTGIGGLAGGSSGNISDSSASGNVTGYNGVGGFVGNNDGAISNSSASGAVTGTIDVGGFAGGNSLSGTISGSQSTGDVTGVAHTNPDGHRDEAAVTGGFAGQNQGSLSMVSSTGSVNGATWVGGLVGRNLYGSVDSSWASGAVVGTSHVGALVGSNEGTGDTVGTITNSYWNREASGQDQAVGDESGPTRNDATGLTNEQFNDVGYYVNGTIGQVLAARADATAAAQAAAAQAAAEAAAASAQTAAAAADRALASANAAGVLRANVDAAQVRAGTVVRQAQFDPSDALARTLASANASVKSPPAIDANIVFTNAPSYSADVKRIEVDGQIFNLDDEDTKK